MKILHIIAGAQHGGAESCAIDTMRALADAGIHQTIISRSHPTFLKVISDCNLRHYPLSFNRFLKWQQMARIRNIITAEMPDIIHSWMNRAASFTPKRSDTPTLGWFGGYYNLKNYANCSYYMGVTKDIVRYIGQNTNKPDLVYLGHAFGTLAPGGNISRADFDIPKNSKVVLLLSRMHWKKGVDVLIDAASKIENVYFILAGDGPEINKYKTQARNLGLEKRVIFPGWCSDRLGMLNIADVCVLPSRYEPFGIVMPEAWFAGVPLVATKAAGASQYVSDERDGLLVDIDDCEGLIKAIKRALYDKLLRNKLIKGGKATYNLHFRRDVVIKTLIASYNDMVHRFASI